MKHYLVFFITIAEVEKLINNRAEACQMQILGEIIPRIKTKPKLNIDIKQTSVRNQKKTNNNDGTVLANHVEKPIHTY